MKELGSLSNQHIAKLHFMFLALCIAGITGLYAQEKPSIKGKLIDIKSNENVSFASVALIKATDSSPVGGTISDDNGVFIINPAPTGNFKLYISAVGYKPVIKDISVITTGVVDEGTIYLQDTAIMIKETVIVGDRVKAKSEPDKTIFFMTKKMLDASSTGIDVLKMIPGVQIDLMQNILIEGSRNIRIFVDGKERDASFISQLNPNQIDKVEVINKPSSNYDGNATGAINIILKKEKNSGISGQVYAEIPTSGKQIFLRPTYSLNFGYNKLNLYTSYKGEFTYLEIHEETNKKQFNDDGNIEFNSNQYVYQKNWSHRFNYGFDYFINDHSQFNFFAFYNPYSRELDGYADSKISGIAESYWKAKKEDTDRNHSTFYSMYYKHDFEKEGRALTFEMNNYNLKADNSTQYTPVETDYVQSARINAVRPQQNELSAKLDYVSPWNKINFGTGMKAKYKLLQDRNIPDFNYTEEIFAAYTTIDYKHAKYDINLGGRAEQYVTILENNFNHTGLSFFPHFSFNFKLSSRQNFQAAFNRSIIRPDIYQLNPSISVDDPYTVTRGNSLLEAEFLNTFLLEHSVQFKGNLISSRAFINILNNSIEDLTFINDTNAFETQVNNLGKINQIGMQFSGTIKWGIATFNPYVRAYHLRTYGNNLAKQHEIKEKHYLGIDGSLSAILSFRHELSLSMVIQYESPTNNVQGKFYSGALYFLSLEKTFKQKFKVGIVSALPFTKNFIYRGSEVNGPDFYSRYNGYVNVSQPLCWFKVSYQFNSGKSRDNINRSTDESINIPKKGF
jgi:hypothetical protein